MERKIDCSQVNRMIVYRLLFLFTRGSNLSLPQLFLQLSLFSPAIKRSRERGGLLSYRSVFLDEFTPHCLFTREQTGKISYRSTFRVTFLSFHVLECNEMFKSIPM